MRRDLGSLNTYTAGGLREVRGYLRKAYGEDFVDLDRAVIRRINALPTRGASPTDIQMAHRDAPHT